MDNFIKKLWPGMRVILRNGNIGLLIPTKDIVNGIRGFSILYDNNRYDVLNTNTYSSDLIKLPGPFDDKDDEETRSRWDIMAVYDMPSNYGNKSLYFTLNAKDKLWEREEPIEMTIREIEEKLGHSIKIVKEK